mgnify:CR=1 FL=1
MLLRRKRKHRRRLWAPILALILMAVVAAEARLLFSDAYLGAPDLSFISRILHRQTDWRLILVNSRHAVPSDYEPALLRLSNGVEVDERIYPDLQEMFDAARAQGVNPTVVEGYRSHEDQTAMMQSYVDRYIGQGYDRSEAEVMAREYVAEPGTSEHELGIAVDVGAGSGSGAEQVYAWLAENAYEYGFILRYPEDGEEITGIAYEPWHYRYVGREAALEIYTRDITLEEYLKAR